MNVDRARGLRLGMTDAEQALWYRLRNRQLEGCKFRRQYGIEAYRLDFYSPELKLGNDVDGETHTTADPASPPQRQEEFTAMAAAFQAARNREKQATTDEEQPSPMLSCFFL